MKNFEILKSLFPLIIFISQFSIGGANSESTKSDDDKDETEGPYNHEIEETIPLLSACNISESAVPSSSRRDEEEIFVEKDRLSDLLKEDIPSEALSEENYSFLEWKRSKSAKLMESIPSTSKSTEDRRISSCTSFIRRVEKSINVHSERFDVASPDTKTSEDSLEGKEYFTFHREFDSDHTPLTSPRTPKTSPLFRFSTQQSPAAVETLIGDLTDIEEYNVRTAYTWRKSKRKRIMSYIRRKLCCLKRRSRALLGKKVVDFNLRDRENFRMDVKSARDTVYSFENCPQLELTFRKCKRVKFNFQNCRNMRVIMGGNHHCSMLLRNCVPIGGVSVLKCCHFQTKIEYCTNVKMVLVEESKDSHVNVLLSEL